MCTSHQQFGREVAIVSKCLSGAFIPGVVFALLICGQVAAQDAPVDDEAAFDEALSQFGYAGGAAWQCSDESARDPVLEQAMVVYNRLTQLFGTDRSFSFAAAFGAGTVDEIDKAACESFMNGFADGLEAGIPSEEWQS